MARTRKYHPEWGNPITKGHTWNILTDKRMLPEKIQITRSHEAQEERPKCGCFSPSYKENKILTGANMEIKCRAETEGNATQRLSHLGIHPIYSYQIKALLWMPRSAC